MNLRSCIESADRCILICHGDRGWACTRAEGADYSVLEWHDHPAESVRAHTGKLPVLDKYEQRRTKAIERWCADRNMAWACEWWQQKWHRPFGRTGGQVHAFA